ncbi:hypothetical protein D3C81_237360 [compost metagenome]
MDRTLPSNATLYKGTMVEMLQFMLKQPINSACMFVTGLDTSEDLTHRWELSLEILKEEGHDFEAFIEQHAISIKRAWHDQKFDGGGVVNDGPTMTVITMQQWAEKFPDSKVVIVTDDLDIAGLYENIGYLPR